VSVGVFTISSDLRPGLKAVVATRPKALRLVYEFSFGCLQMKHKVPFDYVRLRLSPLGMTEYGASGA